jgi:hypothetical protein
VTHKFDLFRSQLIPIMFLVTSVAVTMVLAGRESVAPSAACDYFVSATVNAARGQPVQQKDNYFASIVEARDAVRTKLSEVNCPASCRPLRMSLARPYLERQHSHRPDDSYLCWCNYCFGIIYRKFVWQFNDRARVVGLTRLRNSVFCCVRCMSHGISLPFLPGR